MSCCGTKTFQGRISVSYLSVWGKHLVLALALILIALVTVRESKGSVLIEGTFSENGISPHIPSFDGERESYGVFQVYLQKTSWIIKYLNLSALTNSQLISSGEVASCDGTNIYVIGQVNPARLALNQGNSSNTDGFFKLSSTIYGGTYPPTSEPFLHNLWLAMLSGTVFTSPMGSCKPILGTDLSMFYNTNFTCNYVWVTNPGADYQRKIIFHSNTNGTWLQRDRNNYGKLGFYRLGPPFEHGLDVGVADWAEQTNIAGFCFPLQYSLSTFMPSYASKAKNGQEPWYVFKCAVTNATITGAQAVPLQPDDETIVFDHRFLSIGYPNVDYVITNRCWPTSDGKRLAQNFRNARKETLEAASLRELGIPGF
jgi:hypothetical protein